MSKPLHTPGLWIGKEKIKDERGRLIARVEYSGFASANGIPLPEGVANAQLITAAPAMLEALEEISTFPTWGEQRHEEIVAIAKKAIAKAEGKK